jgi:large subunit ribosomal protein L25
VRGASRKDVMEEVVLQAKSRTITGKQVKALRAAGRLPAVIYGKGFEPVAISLDMRDSLKILPTVSTSQLIVVDVDGVKHTTLVREKQREPIGGSLLHIDFLEVSLTEKLRAFVGIHFDGDSPAVKNYDGVVVIGTEEIEVEALPRDLPERITVDLSSLAEIGDAIFVRDLDVPAKVRVLTDPDEIVVNITAQAYAAELEAEEGAVPEPEVLERGKKEEENY